MKTEWSDVGASQATPRIASHQKLAERQGRVLPKRLQREHGPASTFNLDFRPPGL